MIARIYLQCLLLLLFLPFRTLSFRHNFFAINKVSSHHSYSFAFSKHKIPTKEVSMTSDNCVDDKIINRSNWISDFTKSVNVIWDFSRPHTLVGSAISVLCLYAYAVPPSFWVTPKFWYSILVATVPSLLMNIYITGLNQITDVEIDKINKPYLPIASGKLSKQNANIIVLACLAISLSFAVVVNNWPLRLALVGSAFLGTLYSLPPFRLKRFPILAAFCILAVRGSLVNLSFFLAAKIQVLNMNIPTLMSAVRMFPESLVLTAFFAIFGFVIAIMKDVPDVKGDKIFKISSFSVKLGQEKVFRFACSLLTLLLASTGSVIGIGSLLLCAPRDLLCISPLINGIRSSEYFAPFQNLLLLPLPQWKLQKSLPRVFAGSVLISFAVDLWQKSRKINAADDVQVYRYYMDVWNVFYLCYFLLPFLQ